MDIGKIKELVELDEEGAVVPITGKDDEPYLAADGTPCTITVLGSESKRVKAAQMAIQRRRVKPGRRGFSFTPEEAELARIEQAAAAVIDWHGWEDGNGKPVPCIPENIKELLSIQHILVQVELGIGNHSFFIERP